MGFVAFWYFGEGWAVGFVLWPPSLRYLPDFFAVNSLFQGVNNSSQSSEILESIAWPQMVILP